MRARMLALAALGVSLGLACEVGPKSGRGLRLPAGDATRGALAFQELGCNECHRIADEPVAATSEGRDERVLLGGGVSRIETHGELVTSIVHPSYEISEKYAKEGDLSKMQSLNERMTVSELIDLTEYLQSKYRIEREPLYIP